MTAPVAVSVVIPAWNAQRYLAEAIESALAQTIRPAEIIVVDDGSTDRTAEIAGRFGPPVQVVRQEHGGAGAARNRGAGLARGKFLAFLDSDDLWLPEKTALQATAFERDPQLDMVFGGMRQFHSSDLTPDLRARIQGDGQVLTGISSGTMLIRRDSFLRAEPFATRWRVGEFIDWYAKAQERGLKSATLAEIVMLRRLHADNMGRRERESRGDFVKILKARLDRRRTAGEMNPPEGEGPH